MTHLDGNVAKNFNSSECLSQSTLQNLFNDNFISYNQRITLCFSINIILLKLKHKGWIKTTIMLSVFFTRMSQNTIKLNQIFKTGLFKTYIQLEQIKIKRYLSLCLTFWSVIRLAPKNFFVLCFMLGDGKFWSGGKNGGRGQNCPRYGWVSG